MAVHFKVFAILLVVCLALAASDKKDTKKNIQKQKQCDTCSDDYKPVCGTDGANKPITFGNSCVMKKAGCENNKQYTKVNDGECKNGGGIRLS